MIGNYGCCFGGEQFIGFIDEVRLWNVARTQTDIQNFMFNPLPTPSLQPGLLAYYQFGSLLNQQGDPTWDGFLAGTASIGAVNPFCGALSPVCAVLDGGFRRFTLATSGDGLDFEWHWEGSAVQAYELLAGPTHDRLAPMDRLDAGQTAFRLPTLPATKTWFQVVAIAADGRRTASNIVEYAPRTQALALTHAQGRVHIHGPAGPLNWRLIDGLGRVLLAGALPGFTGDAEVDLPDGLRGGVIMEVRSTQGRVHRRLLL